MPIEEIRVREVKSRTCTAGTTDHQTELNSFLDIFLATELDLKSDTNSTEATSAATRSINQGREKGIELTRMGYNVEGGGGRVARSSQHTAIRG